MKVRILVLNENNTCKGFDSLHYFVSLSAFKEAYKLKYIECFLKENAKEYDTDYTLVYGDLKFRYIKFEAGIIEEQVTDTSLAINE